MSKPIPPRSADPESGYRVPDRTPPEEPTNPVQSASRTMELIEVLKESGGATIGEIATELDVSKGTASNYVSTLREEGFVTKLETGEFDIGLRVLDVCNKSIRERELFTEGKPKIDALAEEFEGVFTVMVPEHGYGYCLYSRTTSDLISKNRLAQGTRRYLHCNGPGLSILSGMETETVEDIVDRYGLLSCDTGCEFDCPLAKYARELPVERESLYDRLAAIDEQGFAVTDHGQIACLGVPIFGSGDTVVGSVGVLAPRRTIYTEQAADPELISAMKDAATAIGINIV
ncbi:helix-turn-helix domain-containing protein [Halodesulfurarchaeum sp. HSR-GB]|uniref:IclR family transcriptional regulator n=1 Tax=Halodesulfurarchaeum sp. HSR-GB TaxID=3074077 RepID=UPI0028637AB7|nr:helix-turn-helix domain-containing protein [Halodesulfurarchaeum sp. HSR-GB]MDR5656534.1 helix-turn-helix domain-containing protein [Halodesulfurarchaeum sp. HSR-GB]